MNTTPKSEKGPAVTDEDVEFLDGLLELATALELDLPLGGAGTRRETLRLQELRCRLAGGTFVREQDPCQDQFF